MKILELNFERGWRGGERQTIYNMQGFIDAGCEVDLVCRKGEALESHALSNGFRVHSFNNTLGVFFFLLTKGSAYNIWHAQTSHILTYCILAKPFTKAKLVFTRRVSFIPKGVFTKMKYRITDKLVGISDTVKTIIANFSGKDVDMISDVVVPVSLNKTRAEQVISKLGINGKKIIGTIAMLSKDKDPLTMIGAIKDLVAQRSDFVFLHFGTGELEQEVKDIIDSLNLGSVYHLMGFDENVQDFFSVFDVFVMSSKEEGLCSSVLDAFAYQVPVVATNAGGLNDLLKNDRGILVNKGDAQMLALAVNSVLNDKETSMQMTNNANVYVLRNHSKDYITKEYLDLFMTI